MKYAYPLVWVLMILSCKKDSKESGNLQQVSAFEMIDASRSNVDFVNKVEDQKDFNVLSYRNYYNGGGVAIGDINNDGLNDLFFTANMESNKLYLNKGDFKFEDISTKAGIKGKRSWTTGVTMADVNGDGLLDIYVCYSGDAQKENKENELFINNGNLTFTERAAEFGLNDPGLTTHAAFFDFDLDGDLDCYVLNNSYKDPERISLYSRNRFEYDAVGGDRLYRNDKGHFTNITEASGIYSSNIGFGLGISTGDINGDYYPDLYISNDFWERDYLYINQKNGTFKEELTERVPYTSVASMGADIADINNDGSLDIFSTDMLPPDNKRLKAATKFDEYYQFDLKFRNSYYYQFVQNCMQVNDGHGDFTETAFFSGIGATDWSWAALIFDMNLDGSKDLFVSNGVYHDITDSDFMEFIADKDKVKEVVIKNGRYDFRDFVNFLPHNQRKNYAFINNGKLKFENRAKDLGLDEPSYSNGSAYGDLDNDGDFDLVVNNVNMPAFIYQNKAVEEGASFLKIQLEGTEYNKKGIGATVWAYQDGASQVLQSFASRGFESSVDSDLIFGLLKDEKIDSVRVIWPDHKTQLLTEVKPNTVLKLQYTQAKDKFEIIPPSLQTTFSDITQKAIGDFKHSENLHNDFDNNRLLPHMLSNEGPKIVTGDVNGDGKTDFIVGGAQGFSDQLMINTGNGYKLSKQVAFELTKNSETVCGALFDADKDGDLDYMAGMGGNETKGGVESYATAFYLNDGKGNFTKNDLNGPKASGFVSCIKPADYDNDGDVDLFIGGRAIPGAYGLTPRSFVLKNEGGSWADITNEFTGPIGMVTDATWADVNNDKLLDLVVVGEWMPITIFVNQSGILSSPLIIPNSEGWWNTITATDYDQDGDLDFMIGNWGENMKLKATFDRPFSGYFYDFDQNKRSDAILEWYGFEDDKAYPFASKMDLTTQMPGLKKTLLKYQDYAQKQVSDIFEVAILEKAIKRKVTNFNSSVLENDNGALVLKPLQQEVQYSPIFAIISDDLDGDGIKDYMVGGNFYKLKPEIGRHDGFRGGYFKGLGKGNFKYIKPAESGIVMKGEVRSIQKIDQNILVGRNDDKLLVFAKK